ncbi:MAG: hypothetical protein K0S09_1130 [Sphingobacteriaceae bacterium]|jgi:hypothetical protein|nr:hypothetical protein [Sphingobacteriaceae bacterium]
MFLAGQISASAQDTIRRVPVKMSAREISVDYGKLFNESSSVEAKPVRVHTSKAKPSKVAISRKAAALVLAAKKPVTKIELPAMASVAKAAKSSVAEKQIVVAKPAVTVAKPKAVKPKPAALPVKEEVEISEPKPAAVENRAEESTTAQVIVGEDGTKRIDSPEFKKFQKSIESEQEQWDSLANAQLASSDDQYPEDGSAESRMMYLYIGAAVTVAGIVFGLFFGRPAFLLSVVGVVFVMIGLFIQP